MIIFFYVFLLCILISESRYTHKVGILLYVQELPPAIESLTLSLLSVLQESKYQIQVYYLDKLKFDSSYLSSRSHSLSIPLNSKLSSTPFSETEASQILELKFDFFFAVSRCIFPPSKGQGNMFNIFIWAPTLDSFSTEPCKSDASHLITYDRILLGSKSCFEKYTEIMASIYQNFRSQHYIPPSVSVFKHHSSHSNSSASPALSSSEAQYLKSSLHTLVFRHLNIFTSGFKDIVSRGYPVLRSLSYSPSSPALTSDKVALIVEPGINSHFEFCVRNVLAYLGGGWALHVYHLRSNSAFVQDALRDVSLAQFFLLPSEAHNVDEYNRLVRSPAFWDRYSSSKLLLFQSDSIMLRGDIEPFLSFDFVGAPWDLTQNERVVSYIAQGKLRAGVGNGGFSLRSGRAMYQISRDFGALSPPEEQEDMFYARYIESLPLPVPLPSQNQSHPLPSPPNNTRSLTLLVPPLTINRNLPLIPTLSILPLSLNRSLRGSVSSSSLLSPSPLMYRMAPRALAYDFAWEVRCSDPEIASSSKSFKDPLQNPPLGLHAAWYYFDPGILRPVLEKYAIPAHLLTEEGKERVKRIQEEVEERQKSHKSRTLQISFDPFDFSEQVTSLS